MDVKLLKIGSLSFVGDQVKLPSMRKLKATLDGSVKRHPDGFGFFIPDDKAHPDVYIPKHTMNGVMTFDRVKIQVYPESGGERFRGDIVEILERKTIRVVGVYFPINDKWALLKDEGKAWGQDLRIPVDKSMGAKKGELVAANIVSYPDSDDGFIGEVVEIIGDAMDPLTDVKRVLFTNNIPHEFPAAVLKEASKFTEHVSQKDIAGRRDLRSLNFITIDGATAKDFDDAIYIEQNHQGWVLYVAIADVSHYVQEGSAIDEEAYVRGNSVYFPNFVVPMLPEVLSNGLCSLNPHLPRLSLVAEMHMDFTGAVHRSEFYEAVIESKARVIYGEAQEIIDGNPIEKLSHVKADILRAADLAKILMAKRFKEGSLDLEIPETQIVLDASGVPVDMVRSERLFAHRLIEEMMLAANVAVAKFLGERGVEALYRIHDSPNEMAIEMLERYLHNFGSRVNFEGSGKLQKRLTKALQEFEGKPEALVLNILALRSMSQAKYSPQNIGHFGLGFDHYAHFTSPIRRYPDLIIHRLVKKAVMPNSKYKFISLEDLETAGLMLSATEQRATKSERQFVAIKKARLMNKYLGKEFDGMISSVTKFGVFVLLREFEVDGLIRTEALAKEHLLFDEDNLALVGKRSGVRFQIGDQIRIRVVSAEIDDGKIDFEPADRPSRSVGQDREERQRRGSKFAKDHGKKGGKGPRRDQRNQSEKSHQKKGRDGHREEAPKSRKLRYAEQMEQAQPESRSRASSPADTETSARGALFDKAIAKWKAREGISGDSPRSKDRRSGKDRRDEGHDDRSGGKKTDHPYFSKFAGKGKSGGKKKSSRQGKRR